MADEVVFCGNKPCENVAGHYVIATGMPLCHICVRAFMLGRGITDPVDVLAPVSVMNEWYVVVAETKNTTFKVRWFGEEKTVWAYVDGMPTDLFESLMKSGEVSQQEIVDISIHPVGRDEQDV